MNVLAIGSHPDDIEFGCAGTLIKHVDNGDFVHILCMSGNIQRRSYSIRASALIGASIEILDYEDGEVPFNKETINRIESIITQYNIDTIYTHWTHDTHQDHINTVNASLAAGRHINNFFCYEQVPLPRVGIDYPKVNYYVDITDVFDYKIMVCKEHFGEIVKFNSRNQDILEYTTDMAKYRGNQIGVKYAEAFSVLKMKSEL